MRRNIPAIFAILTLLVLILCSACIGQPSPDNLQPPPDTPSPHDVGLARVSAPDESPYISFETAYRELQMYRPDITNESTVIKTVYFVHGTNVDGGGNATGWIFGMSYSNVTGLLAYDRGGWKTIPWNTPVLPAPINTKNIVLPGRLFSQNKAVILGNPSPSVPERRDLELIRGIYTLTITSGSTSRILTFNATTGELIGAP